MDKLELKHIIPYLPYGLKVLSEYNEVSEINSIHWSLDGHLRTELNLCVQKSPPRFRGANLEHVKPILRPMSDLTREILFDAKFHGYIDYLTHEFTAWVDKDGIDHVINRLPYGHAVWLFKNHYDAFGLIPAGLAIDSNTINQ